MNVEQIAADLFGKMAGHIAKQLAPIVERLAAVEARQPEKGEKGDDGKSVTTDDIQPLVQAEVSKAVSAIPVPKDGEPGADADMDALKEQAIDAAKDAAKEWLKENPPSDGKDGVNGVDGKSLTAEDAEAVLARYIDSWALDFERRAQGILERSVDRLPKPADGKDGLGFDDLSMQFDGERGFSVKFVRGDQIKAFDFSLPVPIYRGVFKDGAYSKFDTVTWGGSVWIAQKDTENRPGGNEDWQLMVKQGGEGKSAFAIAQERGFTGTKQEWVSSLYPVGETIVKVRP